MLVGADNWQGDLPPAKTALVATSPGADLTALTTELSNLMPQAHITTVEGQLRQLRDSPTVAGLSTIFATLTAVTALLMMLAITTSQIMTADDRRASAAVLRTLGMRPGQLRALTAWELGPVVLVALALGVAVGIGIAALMLATVDFRALTGGSLDPALYLDPLWVGGWVPVSCSPPS
ncbi:FtsX-like permease family protein [Tessaracoccus sp. HDW20]|uniref:FtsX-like permease family protein n=1 Tax=Tessaracoccus coleopterorum TaxID=2714950 RepID=UPI001E568CF4|nr:FtsX-like permease family protein [Tessaracoccus coleopterorum]NHB84190.1 FtsX-like permease family protein [Tessaracoccus coleopterorum]